MKSIRCIYCGATEGEPIEEDVPIIGIGDNVMMFREVVREVSFNTVENEDGETEYVCSECRNRFTYRELREKE